MIQKFEFCNTDFEGAYLIKPFCATDIRGAFIKDYSKEVFEANGLEHNLAEVFYTVSHKGVIRALHFQRVHEQAKLVRCIKGKVFDVIVDLRPESPTFKKWQGFYLSEENMNELYVPEHLHTAILCLNRLLFHTNAVKNSTANMMTALCTTIRIWELNGRLMKSAVLKISLLPTKIKIFNRSRNMRKCILNKF